MIETFFVVFLDVNYLLCSGVSGSSTATRTYFLERNEIICEAFTLVSIHAGTLEMFQTKLAGLAGSYAKKNSIEVLPLLIS